MLDDYLKGGTLDGSVSFMASWRDEAGRWRRRRVSLDELAAYVLAIQAKRDLSQDAALTAAEDRQASRDAAQNTVQSTQSARLAALEAKPEEVVPFSGAITVGAVSIGTRTYTVSGLTGLAANERVVVEATGALPAGLSITAARVPSAGTVEVTVATSVALTGSRTIPLAITALR